MRGTIETIVDAFEAGQLSRRQLVLRLTAMATGISAVSSVGQAASDDATPTFQARSLDHIALRVTDVQRSRTFYEEHLGLRVWRDGGANNCFLQCGKNNFVALFRADEPAMDHYCYSIDNYDVEKVVERLKQADLKPRRESNRVYFPDPDGLEVQLASPARFGE